MVSNIGNNIHFEETPKLAFKTLDLNAIYRNDDYIVYYDITRLISRCKKPFATGIDRVDIEYLKKHLSDKRIELRCLALVDNKIRVVDQSTVQRFTTALDWIWQGGTFKKCPSTFLENGNYLNSSLLKRFKLRKFGNLVFDPNKFVEDPKRKSFYFNASHVGILSLKNRVCCKFFQNFKGSVI